MAKNNIKFKLEGFAEVKKALQQLGKDINDKITYDLNRSASKIVVEELRASVPESKESTKTSKNKIESNIIVKKSRSKSGTLIGFTNRVFFVPWIEFGTKIRKTKGKGKRIKKPANRGKMNPKPFVAKAHQSAFPKVVNHFQANYLKLVNRSLKKHLRRLRQSK